MRELISVIMSVYNETNIDLLLSINSILNQTYENLEFIIVDDNPDNKRIKEVLDQQTDPRIKIIYNKANMGLVFSLNEALKHVNGEFVARMDADDISLQNRLEVEYDYMLKHNLDLIGTWIRLIDTRNRYIGELRFPTTTDGIKKQIRYGGCIAHSTWLGKSEVFFSLNGYRQMAYCEDYNFLLRAVAKGYKLGNVPYYGLNYRIRENGISLSNKNKQLIIRRFLSENMLNINLVTEEDLKKYIESKKFYKELSKLNSYEIAKNNLHNHNWGAIIQLLKNKNLYKYIYEKYAGYIYRKLHIKEDYNDY